MFFSAATRYQLLPRLDRWVLNETMRQLQPHAALLSGWNTSFAINISGQSLGDAEFADFARATLKSSGIDPKWITWKSQRVPPSATSKSPSGLFRA